MATLELKNIVSSRDGSLGMGEPEHAHANMTRRVFFADAQGDLEQCSYEAFMSEGKRARRYATQFKASDVILG